jgi:hypothetical protein
MESNQQHLDTLQDIKRIMERSSRFISLSGWSGIAAGLCALAGAWLAAGRIHAYKLAYQITDPGYYRGNPACPECRYSLAMELFGIAAGVFIAAIILAFLFTYMRSKKNNLPMWDKTASRLLWNTLVPIAVGGIVIINQLTETHYLLVAPLCLVFYGLGLVNGSKYTLGEVKYLGYGQILLGLVNLWNPGYGLFFWAMGFGVLHIIYGIVMWWKYERK